MDQKDVNKVFKNEEIDLRSLVQLLWNGKKFIIKITSIFIVIGLIVALTSKVEYVSFCQLMPENQEDSKGSLGGLSSLAGIAGINLNLGNSGALTPELYPEIVKSVPFQAEMINRPIYFEKADSVLSSYIYFRDFDKLSFIDYVTKYTIGLPFQIKSLFNSESKQTSSEFPITKKGELIRLNKADWSALEAFKERVNVSISIETGIVTVSMEMPDAFVAARLTELVVEKLTSEVTTYKIEKAKLSLEFIQERFQEAQKQYDQKQLQFARFVDKNKNISSSIARIEQMKLENEVSLFFEVYKGLATQLEQAKIKVKEETPIFTILEPVQISVDKSKPKRAVIMVLFTGLGIVTAISIMLFKDYFKYENRK